MLSACSNNNELPEQPIRTVRIETVSTFNVLSQRHFVGRIDAISTSNLSFQVPGHLLEFPAKEGVLIPQGELIAALDESDYRLALKQAKAGHYQAQLDLIRKRNLFHSGSLPKAMLDQAETSYKLAQVAVETAQRNLSYTRIIAPFDALVSQRLIDSHTNVSAYQPIVRVQALSELRVRINIPENMVKWLDHIDQFEIVAIFKDRPKERFPLTYREHMTEAGSVAQTYEVIFGLSREDNKHVLPGMTVTVLISKQQDEAAQLLAIPISAINYDEQGTPRVWVFDPKTETVSPRHVKLGAIHKHKIPVFSGLQEGEQIVSAGAHLLRDGMKVRRFVSF